MPYMRQPPQFAVIPMISLFHQYTTFITFVAVFERANQHSQRYLQAKTNWGQLVDSMICISMLLRVLQGHVGKSDKIYGLALFWLFRPTLFASLLMWTIWDAIIYNSGCGHTIIERSQN